MQLLNDGTLMLRFLSVGVVVVGLNDSLWIAVLVLFGRWMKLFLPAVLSSLFFFFMDGFESCAGPGMECVLFMRRMNGHSVSVLLMRPHHRMLTRSTTS